MMPGLPLPSLRAAAFAALALALGACRSEPPRRTRATPARRRHGRRRGVPAHPRRRERGALARRQAHRGNLLERGRPGGVRDRRARARRSNYLTKIAPGTLIHAFGWSGIACSWWASSSPTRAASASSRAAARPTAWSCTTPSRSRPRREARARVPDGRAARRGTGASARVDTSWPLLVHPSLPGAVIHWLPDDPDHVLINWWQSSEEGASALRARVRDGFPNGGRAARRRAWTSGTPITRAACARAAAAARTASRAIVVGRPHGRRAVRGAHRRQQRRSRPTSSSRASTPTRRSLYLYGDRRERPQGAARVRPRQAAPRARSLRGQELRRRRARDLAARRRALGGRGRRGEARAPLLRPRGAARAGLDRRRVAGHDEPDRQLRPRGEDRDRAHQRRHQPARLLPLRPRAQADGLPVHRESGRSTAASSRR